MEKEEGGKAGRRGGKGGKRGEGEGETAGNMKSSEGVCECVESETYELDFTTINSDTQHGPCGIAPLQPPPPPAPPSTGRDRLIDRLTSPQI